MAAGAGDGDGVKQLEKVEVESSKNRLGCALFGWELGPGIEGGLRTAKYLVDVPGCLQLCAEGGRFPFIGEGKLILEVVEAVVDGSCATRQ